MGIKLKQPISFALPLAFSANAIAMLWLIRVGAEDEVASSYENQSEYLEAET